MSRAGELAVARGGALNERLRVALKAVWGARYLRSVTIDALSGDGAALSRELDLAVGVER